MAIEFGETQHAMILAERGLDMADAGEVFVGVTLTVEDDRHDYGEPRFITIGKLRGRVVVLVRPRAAISVE